MPEPTPLPTAQHPPAHGHDGAGGHLHGHAHGHAHGETRADVHRHAHHPAHGHAATAPAPAALPFSLLMAGVPGRLAGACSLLVLLWMAVAWALGDPA